MDSVDVYLLHWPTPPVDQETQTFKPVPFYKVWAQMEEVQQKGKLKSIRHTCAYFRLDKIDWRV